MADTEAPASRYGDVSLAQWLSFPRDGGNVESKKRLCNSCQRQVNWWCQRRFPVFDEQGRRSLVRQCNDCMVRSGASTNRDSNHNNYPINSRIYFEMTAQYGN
jgi:hypothetical protein